MVPCKQIPCCCVAISIGSSSIFEFRDFCTEAHCGWSGEGLRAFTIPLNLSLFPCRRIWPPYGHGNLPCDQSMRHGKPSKNQRNGSDAAASDTSSNPHHNISRIERSNRFLLVVAILLAESHMWQFSPSIQASAKDAVNKMYLSGRDFLHSARRQQEHIVDMTTKPRIAILLTLVPSPMWSQEAN